MKQFNWIEQLKENFIKENGTEPNVLLLGHAELVALYDCIEETNSNSSKVEPISPENVTFVRFNYYDPALLLRSGRYFTLFGLHIDYLTDSEGHLKSEGAELKSVSGPEVVERMQKKPPLGLRPQHVADRDRVQEIYAAIWRYTSVKQAIPLEWAQEIKQIRERNTRENWAWIESQVPHIEFTVSLSSEEKSDGI